MRIVTGIPYEEIVPWVRVYRHTTNHINVGAYGPNGVPHALLGGIMEKVLSQTLCPVFTVHLEELVLVTV